MWAATGAGVGPNHYCVELLELPIGLAHYGAHGVRRPLAALQNVPKLPRARVSHRGDSDGRARPRRGAGVLVECVSSDIERDVVYISTLTHLQFVLSDSRHSNDR
jgi:hypothetical protein